MLRRPFIAALAAGLAFAGPLLAQEPPPRQLTVVGSAEIEAVPDLATVTAGVETQAPTAAEALAANSQAMATVFAALEAAGIARRDLQTSQLSLSPVYEPYRDGAEQPQRIVAYQASNLLTVTVREVGKLGGVIDELAEAGANRLHGVGFEVARPRPVLDEARRQAVVDARAKAELFAEAAGVTLGPVVSLTESVAQAPVAHRARADMAMEAAPVAEGTVSLGAEVEVVYRLE
jgi:uncharacterized protein YggE